MPMLDTHVAFWIVADPDRLSSKAKEVLDEARKRATGLFISDVSFYEIASMVARKRVALDVSLESFLEEMESRFSVLSVTRQIAARSVELPSTYPKDPLDRIIGATALIEGVPLITADQNIQKSNAVRTIW